MSITKTLLSYDQFKQMLLEMLEALIPPEAALHLQSVTKNNQIHLDGLAILNTDKNISPTIYINYYYDDYVDHFGSQIEDDAISTESFADELSHYFLDLSHTILKIHQENLPPTNFNVDFFQDFENVKEQLVFKLVNYDKNKDLLRKIPHIPYLDLAIVFLCYLDPLFGSNATILITNEHLNLWKIKDQMLYEIAIHNTPKILPEELSTMEELIGNLMLSSGDECFEGAFCDSCASDMYILSNASKVFGASCILYQNLLHHLSDHFSSSFYLLPSSIHEVILIPTRDSSCLSQFTQMVREVNETQLRAEEILSDHAYYYDRSKKALMYC